MEDEREELFEEEIVTEPPREPDVTILQILSQIQDILLSADGEHTYNLWVYERAEKDWHETVLEAVNERFDLFPGAKVNLRGRDMVVAEGFNSDGGGFVYLEPIKTTVGRPKTKAEYCQWWREQLEARGVQLRKATAYQEQPLPYVDYIGEER